VAGGPRWRPGDNITDDVVTHAENWPDGVGLKRRVNGVWTPVTWREFAGQVSEIAAGFIAAGIQPGDRVGLMSRTRFEWTLLDYAILAAGGVVVPAIMKIGAAIPDITFTRTGVPRRLLKIPNQPANAPLSRGAGICAGYHPVPREGIAPATTTR
jgi:long-subunit acyl-CoA synthetase (AMP-forming)